MKKGLLLTLVVAVALLSSSSFAYAPVLQNIPDIIIGDHEQGDTNNFFVFSDAFVFDTYVTDGDSTISDMKWSYKKTGQTAGGAQTIIINNMDEEAADFVNPANNIRSGFTTATFRNDTLSPRTGSAPYADPTELVNVYLALYVSDGAFVDSEEITVYSADNGIDGYSGLGISPSYTESWDTQNDWQCWDGYSGAAAASYGSYDSGNKRISVGFPVVPFGGAGWTQWLKWNSGHTGVDMTITYAASTVFALKAKLSADANTTVPQVRIRVGAEDNVWTACLLPAADGTNPSQGGVPTTTPTDFMMVWEPQHSTANAFLAFDGYAGTSYTGTIYIDEINMYQIPVAQITASSEASIASFTGWATIGSGVTVGSTSITYGAIDSTQGWHTAGQFITLTNPAAAGNIYKLTYPIRKSGSTNVDQIRLRVSDTFNGSYTSNMVISDTGFVTTSNQSFYLYHKAENGRATTPFAGDLTVFCDGIRTVGATAATKILGTPLTIEKVTIPTLN